MTSFAQPGLETTPKRLAFYTCYFGGDFNYSKLIPPIPSLEYDCYYFTNNHDIYAQLENTAWKRVFMDTIPIHDCHVKDNMSAKEIRVCPHRFSWLKEYAYLCWFDSKVQVYEDKVLECVLTLENSDKIMALTKHVCSDTFKTVWDEYNLAMIYDKYRMEQDRNLAYMTKHLENGYSEHLDVHFCSTVTLKKNCERMIEFDELWYAHILECGIECQISLSFVQQKYIDWIHVLESKSIWKYFYE